MSPTSGSNAYSTSPERVPWAIPNSRASSGTHSALAARGRGEELIEARARAAVLNAADRLGKQLVLMVENLQDLCGDVDEDFGWKLREALQSQPEIMLLATATRSLSDSGRKQPICWKIAADW